MFVWNAFSDVVARAACWARPCTHTWIIDDEEIHFSIRKMQVVVKTRFEELVLPKLFKDPKIHFDDIIGNFEPSLVKGKITSAPPTSQLRHIWYLDRNISVHLMEGAQRLQWKVLNAAMRTTHWTEIPLFKRKKEELLKELLETKQPIGCQDGVPVLEKTGKPLSQWRLGNNREISVILNSGRPMWRIVNTLLKTTNWYPIDPSILANAKERLKKIAAQPPFLESAKVVISPCNHYLSVFGEHTVTEKKWVMTLISAGKSELQTRQSFVVFGHSQLIVEGMEDGFPLARIIHIGRTDNRPGIFCKISYAHPTVIGWTSRSPSKHVDKEIVEKMLIKIDLERPIPFNKYSKRSDHRTYNCATWAIKQGESCGMQFPVGIIDKFVTLPGNYTPISNPMRPQH